MYCIQTLMLSGSFYAPLATEFKEHVQRVPGMSKHFRPLLKEYVIPTHQNSLTETTSREIYASHVVPQTLKDSPPAWYWVGATTGVVRFLDTFGFRSVWVSYSFGDCLAFVSGRSCR